MDVEALDLHETQRRALTVLVNEYQQRGSPVNSNVLAERMDRTPGTIRNKMPQLVSLGLVEGLAGPTGGYEPTEKAYQVLDRDPDTERESVTVAHDFERVDATVESISFTNVNHPTDCRAWVEFQTAMPALEVGDAVAIGPTARADLVVAGEVHTTNDTGNRISITVSQIEAPVSDE
jgi:predicted transcriptional regulator